MNSDYLENVSQSFDRAASSYEQWDALQKMIGDDLLERIHWLKKTPKNILDVGAGTGRLSRLLSQHYDNVYSLDLAPNMLKQARKQTSSAQQICADAMHLPFADNSIDLLVSNLMLQWCNDVNAVFSECARVLKPDGALFFSTLGPDTLKELRESWASVDTLQHVNHFWDMHEYGDAVLNAGFSNPVIDVDRIQLHYPDVHGVMKALKGIGAHNITAGRAHGLTGKTKFKAMLAAYEHYRLENGLLPATYEVIYGHAWGKKPAGTVAIPISKIERAQK
ncbi:MAG: malonyl-ACP O-methyltransferase BioC [Thiomargarita sp.]|nr:malonyl-ACP O-methyltransferase BioC [Thiomargarita sp.]